MSSQLLIAIQQHDLKHIDDLLSSGADPNACDPHQPAWSPLMVAVDEINEGGSINAIVLLLRHGAFVNVDKSTPEVTPLTVAVQNQQMEAARILLAAGAEPNIRTDEGDTPLRLSVELGDVAMASLLLLCGAAKTINDSGGPSGMTALGRAAWMLNLEIIEVLLSAGADPGHLDSDYRIASNRLPPRESSDPQLWDTVMAMLKS